MRSIIALSSIFSILLFVGFVPTSIAQSNLNNQFTQTDDLRYNIFPIISVHVQYNVPYSITNGAVGKIVPYCESASVVISIIPEEDSDDEVGELRIKLPRNLIDTKIADDIDDEFFVLLDGGEIGFDEIRQSNYRELIIPFVSDSKVLEIIGAFIPENPNSSVICNVVHDLPLSYILPPIKQMNNGVDPSEVICKENLLKVYKQSAGYNSARCIDPSSADKLQERSWFLDVKTGTKINN